MGFPLEPKLHIPGCPTPRELRWLPSPILCFSKLLGVATKCSANSISVAPLGVNSSPLVSSKEGMSAWVRVQELWVKTVLSLASSVALGESLGLSQPWSCHLYTGCTVQGCGQAGSSGSHSLASMHSVTSGRLTSFKPWFPHSEMDNGLLRELKLCLVPGWHSVNVNFPSLVPECFFLFYSLSALHKGGTVIHGVAISCQG